MRRLRNIFLKGLAALLPVVLTLYLVYWLATTAEEFLGDALRVVLPAREYWPGLGLLVALAVVMGVGLLVDAYLVQRAIRAGENLLARIPVVKTIFGALKDLTRFLPAGERRDLQRVVLWRVGGARIVGFVTSETVPSRLCSGADRLVAVYFPLSYQLGGHTLFLPPQELEPSELGVEEALRMVLIGGVSAGAPAPVSTAAS